MTENGGKIGVGSGMVTEKRRSRKNQGESENEWSGKR
jgi:hypothetical protein